MKYYYFIETLLNQQINIYWFEVCSTQENLFEDEILENLNEFTCESVVHGLDIMINDLDYHNKMNVNNPLDD